MSKDRIIVIGGATASGKSAFALGLAKKLRPKLNSVIINADSMQVYREIPVVGAQPSAEDCVEVEHALYGFLPANQPCSVGLWLEHVEKAIRETFAQGKQPIVVGGTGMYLRCLIEGVAAIPTIAQEVRARARAMLDEIGHSKFHILLKERDPLAATKLSPTDTQRMLRAWEVLEQTDRSIYEWQQKEHRTLFEAEQFLCSVLNPPREQLYAQCNARFLNMLNMGALQEVDALYDAKLDPSLPAMKALGVPELIAFRRGEIEFERAIELAQQNTRHFAKRQLTWFRNQFSDWPVYASANEGIEAIINQLMQED